MKNIVLAIVITVIIVAGVAGYYYFVREGYSLNVVKPDMAPTPIESETEPIPGPAGDGKPAPENNETNPPEPIPESIEAGNVWIRENSEGGNSLIDRVLKTDDIIRKIVTSADAISRTENPIKHWAFLKPSGELTVEERDGKAYISSKNYDRFTPAVVALDHVETSWLATSYRYLSPLFENAYAELGNPNATWDETFKTTLESLIAMDVPETSPELAGHEGGYIFKDEAIEDLPPVHKLLIRMGPEHATRVREKLKALKLALE